MSARPPVSRNGNSAPFPTAFPIISLAKDPERQARGSLQMSYKIEDDYGVTEARRILQFAQMTPRKVMRRKLPRSRAAVRCARNFRWCCRMRGPATGVGQTVKDLSEDPYAGADVTLTLTAKDEAGNEGRKRTVQYAASGVRLFTKPLARALIEQRRILALDANQNAQVITRRSKR